jgi:hypothetical protein
MIGIGAATLLLVFVVETDRIRLSSEPFGIAPD